MYSNLHVMPEARSPNPGQPQYKMHARTKYSTLVDSLGVCPSNPGTTSTVRLSSQPALRSRLILREMQ